MARIGALVVMGLARTAPKPKSVMMVWKLFDD
jgi:hypothetical protein